MNQSQYWPIEDIFAGALVGAWMGYHATIYEKLLEPHIIIPFILILFIGAAIIAEGIREPLRAKRLIYALVSLWYIGHSLLFLRIIAELPIAPVLVFSSILLIWIDTRLVRLHLW